MGTTRVKFVRSASFGLALGLTAAGLVAGPAQAASLVQSLSQTLDVGGGAYSGQFDVTSYLMSGNDSFKVVSAKVIATGSSNFSPVQTIGQYGNPVQYNSQQRLITPSQPIYGTVCNFFGCREEIVGYTPPVYGTDRFYNVDRTDTLADPFDRMVVDVGEGFGAGVSQTVVNSISAFQIVQQPFLLNETGGFDYFNYRARTITNAFYGPIQATAVLTANDLLDLNASGLLNFTVGAQAGRFNLTGLELQFDLQQMSFGAVPEPNTWAMMILGFGAAGLILRRRHGVLT